MKVAVIGSGYVGLVTGAGLAALGHEVRCVDVVADRVAQINRGKPPFHEPGMPELLTRLVGSGQLRATTDHREAMDGARLSLIAVPTPGEGKKIDLRYIAAAAVDVGRCLRDRGDYHVVTVKSTVVPGTTGGLVRRMVEAASGKQLGQFGLAMNPEFLREGTALADFQDPDRVVIGEADAASGQVLEELYTGFRCPKMHVPLQTAELIKYTSNCLLALLVSFSNEIAGLCEVLPETDVEKVMDGLHFDRRLSPPVDGRKVRPGILSYLRAGAGFGGSCLPKDVNALRAFARGQGIRTPVLDAAVAVNERRPGKIVDLLENHLGPLQDRVVTVLGLAFKAGTDDLRDSPALKLIRSLSERGVLVRGYDPLCVPQARKLFDDSVSLYMDPTQALAGADAAVVATAWPEFAEWDWAALAARMRTPLVLDARNSLRGVQWPPQVQYRTIGTCPEGKRARIARRNAPTSAEAPKSAGADAA
jgi:UDPglucose 6-dehydrogenase/GDP-mannose 6-dehydrogenase